MHVESEKVEHLLTTAPATLVRNDPSVFFSIRDIETQSYPMGDKWFKSLGDTSRSIIQRIQNDLDSVHCAQISAREMFGTAFSSSKSEYDINGGWFHLLVPDVVQDLAERVYDEKDPEYKMKSSQFRINSHLWDNEIQHHISRGDLYEYGVIVDSPSGQILISFSIPWEQSWQQPAPHWTTRLTPSRVYEERKEAMDKFLELVGIPIADRNQPLASPTQQWWNVAEQVNSIVKGSREEAKEIASRNSFRSRMMKLLVSRLGNDPAANQILQTATHIHGYDVTAQMYTPTGVLDAQLHIDENNWLDQHM